MSFKILFIHPIFNVYGGAEKVFIDLYQESKKDFEVQMYSLFKSSNFPDKIIGAKETSPFMSNFLGYKINPFINSHVKSVAKIFAKNYNSGDKIILSQFPASLILYEAFKINKNINFSDVIYVSFEPDRSLYYNSHLKLNYMPPDLIQTKFAIATKFMSSWRKKDKYIIKKIPKIVTLSDYITKMTKLIYKQNNVSTDLCMYVDIVNLKNVNKTIARKKVSEEFNILFSDDELIITSLSRLENSKGILEMIEVLKSLKKKKIKFKCLIGGKGSLYSKIKSLSNNFPEIIPVGFVSNDILNSFYSVGDIFMFLGMKETGGPLTVLEAMYCNSIVIAANDAGPVELIKNNKSGFLVNPKNKSKIIDLIVSISKNKNSTCFKSIRNQAVKSVRKNHSLEIFYNKFKKLLN